MTASSTSGQTSEAKLSYRTSGLSLRADYVAEYDPDADRMDLKAWATITNTTGMDFKNANIKLVAGNVNRTSPQPTPCVMRAMVMQMETASSPLSKGAGSEDLVAYHKYSLPAATTFNDRKTKQLALLNGRGMSVERNLIARSQPYFFTKSLRRKTQEIQAEVQLMFTNNAAAELGVPLPAGVVRAYTEDTDDVPQSLGEGGIDHTVVGSEVSVKLGENFDATIMREKTNFARASDNIALTS